MKKKQKAPVAAILPLVDEFKGNIAAIARRLGVDRHTIYDRIETSPELGEAIASAREAMIDNVESSLYQQAITGNTVAMIFFLKTQGKRRGYVERQELTGADGEKLFSVNMGVLDAGDD